MKQKIKLVQADYYNELCAGIENEIQNLKPLYEIQQIYFFQMSDKDCGQPTAFILFKYVGKNNEI